MENNKNKKSVKFQGDMLNFYDFIQVFVFTTNHHLNKGYHVLLMLRKITFNMIVPGPLKLFRHRRYISDNTINWWYATQYLCFCNGPIKIDPFKKKDAPTGS